MDAYDLLQKRVKSRGPNVESRLANDKLKTLEKALLYSYQAESVYDGDVEHRALINNNKLKMDYDDKIISIPFTSKFRVGTVFYWPRINEHWIVYLRHYSEDAYFRGYVRRAQTVLRWEDKYGVIQEVYAAVRGPVETKIRSEMKSGNAFDIPNYTLSIIVPNNEQTTTLRRYSKIAVNGKMWEVTVADDISEPGVIDLQVVEYYINKDEDMEVLNPAEPLKEGKNLQNIEVETSLDGVEEMELYEPFKLWALVDQDGVRSSELTEDAKFTLLKGNAVLTENFLNVLEPPGLISVQLDIPKIGFKKVFTFEAKALALPAASKYIIHGDESVKAYGKTTYTVSYYLDGVDAPIEQGEWVFAYNDKLFTIASKTKESITFKWKIGMQGSIKLDYVVGGQVVDSKDIKLKSLI